jgi:excisionase family DNA binding protein
MAKRLKDLESKEILNTREAASLIKVTTQTIKNYIYSGKLKAIKTPGGHHRIRRSDLQSLGFVIEEQKEPSQLTAEELTNAYNRLLNQYIATLEALMKALDERDIIASGHSSRVADLSCAIGEELEFDETEARELRLAALLHDVGKIGISENILGKPGRLTDQEYFVVKKHPEIGEKIVGSVEFLKPIARSIRQCHERFDGKGYPDGIAGPDIDLKARIIAVADTYDFLRSDLSFRRALSVDDSIRELKKSAGTQLDPSVVKIFTEDVDRQRISYHTQH